jgi:hypothetical protein
MMYDTQNRCGSGLYPSSAIKNYDTTIRKMDLFPSSGEGRNTPTLLGPLERANLTPPSISVSPATHSFH